MLATLQPSFVEHDASMDPTHAHTAPQDAFLAFHDTDDEDLPVFPDRIVDGDDRCASCSRPISEAEDAMSCEGCPRLANVGCVSWPDVETELRAYGELQRSRNANPIPEASLTPNESAFSSALSDAVQFPACYMPGYIDGKIAALRDLLGDVGMVNYHFEHEMTTLPTKNEGERKQLQQESPLQVQLFAVLQIDARILDHEVAVEHMLAPLQP
ncbi:hypothetical protein HPB50_022829 [Hyalomma asiaticum]|uniref:Uncharacterized protein n=1 Tax=Hyalomma asiaticum TaxID=266040 RepID=A0ACB7T1H1_HYAAI|nr:hypothetical protein HPB50_022829 [Hyalomma asiaticum]